MKPLENIKLHSERQDAMSSEIESSAKERADAIISEAEAKAEAIISDAQSIADRILNDAEKRAKMQESATVKSCEELKRNAKKESESYWNRVSERLDEYLAKHPEISDNIFKI